MVWARIITKATGNTFHHPSNFRFYCVSFSYNSVQSWLILFFRWWLNIFFLMFLSEIVLFDFRWVNFAMTFTLLISFCPLTWPIRACCPKLDKLKAFLLNLHFALILLFGRETTQSLNFGSTNQSDGKYALSFYLEFLVHFIYYTERKIKVFRIAEDNIYYS